MHFDGFARSVEEVALRIRATRGDQADLILWKIPETLAKLWGAMTSAGVRAICMASQTELRLALLLKPIWMDFGSQNGRQELRKSLFLEFLGRSLSESPSEAFWKQFFIVLWKPKPWFLLPLPMFCKVFWFSQFLVSGSFSFDFVSEIRSEMEPNRVKIASHNQYFKH